MLRDIRTDLRDALRTLRRRPGFTLLAVLTLAIGMSVNTVAFTVVDAFLFRRPAFAHLDRLGWIFLATRGNGLGSASLPQYDAFRAEARTLDALVAEGQMPLRWRTDGRSEQIWSLVVSANYFQTLGVRPEAGRLFAENDGGRDVAVVSHAFWTGKLAGAVLGQTTISLNEQVFAVVGVLPAGFEGPGGAYAPDVWVPLERRGALSLPAEFESPGRDWLALVGRRRPGVTAAQAAVDLTAILKRTDVAGVERKGGIRARFAPMANGHPEGRALAFVAAVGMAALAGVLLIACFNVAGLFLVRASERQREMAVRSTLGASPGRLVRQLVTEGLVLAALAGALALALSLASGSLLSVFALPAPIPQQLHLAPGLRSVVFTVLLVLVGGLLPALLPARYAVRHDLQQVLASDAATATGTVARARARRIFQACQVAGSTMFLALAVLFVGSFRHMSSADLGFDTRGVLLATADPETHGRQPQQAETFFRGLEQRLRREPRVRSAAVSTGIPYSISRLRGTTLGVGGQDCRTDKCLGVEMFVVTPGYLEAMQIPLLRGRDLTDKDTQAGGGIVVSRATAERLWPGRNPIGEAVSVGTAREMVEVVGIAADVGARGWFRVQPAPQAYRVMRTADYAGDRIGLVVGVRGDPAPLADTIRRAASDLDPRLPIGSIQTMTELLRLPLWAPRVAALFLGICGALALLLATVGLFGVVSSAAAQRTREFGIRMALGAGGRSILRLVLSEGFVVTAAGGLVGLLAARGLAALLGAALFGVRAGDAWPYAAAAALQVAVALLACVAPARRALRTDLVAVMRSEH